MESRNNLILLSIVAIVAIAGLVMTVNPTLPLYTSDAIDVDLAGEASLSARRTPTPIGSPLLAVTGASICNENDRGNSPLVPGTLQFMIPGYPLSLERDFCDSSSPELREYYCVKTPGTTTYRVFRQSYSCNCVMIQGVGTCR
ncbi:hypothetical protein J4410_05325 [Candidatus Woesearchaeota archaeon]|nr:hypothetical protein [Candidatus Woesearchaeota archaeon]